MSPSISIPSVAVAKQQSSDYIIIWMSHGLQTMSGWTGTGSRRQSVGTKPTSSGHSTSLQEAPSIQNPIRKVLSTLNSCGVRALLMGGQACVLYGGAEFSRDTDIAILASDENVELLRGALRRLAARRITLPPFELQYLMRGHAVHFRCYHAEAMKIRIDVMSLMRGVDPFEQLWERRQKFVIGEDEEYTALSLPDLIRAKKTQRDKDWPMIRRLIEADYVGHPDPTTQKAAFWLLESRTPGMLVELSERFRGLAASLKNVRTALGHAEAGDLAGIEAELEREAQAEREADHQYWEPLRRELEALRGLGLELEEDV